MQINACLMITLVVGQTIAVWQNDFDQPLNFQCPDDQTIDHVKSIHDNGAEDRRFDLGCKSLGFELASAPTCFWESNYANEFDRLLHYECPNNHYMNGMSSVHSNSAEDRQWKFRCCEVPSVHLIDCEFTGWTNQYDREQNYKVPANKGIKGVISIHDSGPEDRLYEYVVCGIEFHDGNPVVG